jgi:hypothetical protein
MQPPIALLRRWAWRRRVEAARVWQDAARREAAEHSAAIRRIAELQCPEFRP